MNNLRKFLIPVYVLFLLGAFIFVSSALNEKTLKVDEKEVTQQVEEKKPVNVVIKIDNGKSVENFDVEATNKNSVIEALEQLRLEGKVTFEMDAFTYGTLINNINGLRAENGYRWVLHHIEDVISTDLEEVMLEDNDTYLFKYERSNDTFE